MNNSDLLVRNANYTDLDQVVELETKIFSAQNIVPFDRGCFEAWLEVYPLGFFVAECVGKVVGYTYTQVIHADFSDPKELARWTSFDVMNDRGYTRASHRADGNYHLGVNIGSVSPGAGKVLVESLANLARQTQKPLLGMSRISGLRVYFDKLMASGVIEAGIGREVKDAIALNYALQCASMVKGAVKLVESSPGRVATLPDLPSITVPDPVLCKYLRNPDFAVWAVLPEFIKDPDSLDYAVLTGPPK